jgi:hypothetical protein
MTVRRTRTLVLAAATAVTAAAVAAPAIAHADQQRPYSFAVIGDVPYGDAMQQSFPAFIEQINADPDVRTVTHLGDIKSGSTTCDDARFAAVRKDFDLFSDPLVYTPGDNEWTDCHRANNGGYHPLERLAKVRSTFFDRPGHTLGADMKVASQDAQGLPENVRWSRAGISFATLHVVGSDNDLAPWTGIGETSPTQAQVREERTRMAATIANLRQAFASAERNGDRVVVLQQQADMFDDTVADPSYSDYAAFKPLVRALVDAASSYDGHVYLFNGDSHRFRQDQPLAAGSRWLSFYGVHGAADNLTRVTVDGSDRGESDWLKVTAQPGSDDLTVQQVPAS